MSHQSNMNLFACDQNILKCVNCSNLFYEVQLNCFLLNFFLSQLILKNVDSLLYVDTDILFLRPVDDIWSFLRKFNSTQIAAMAPEHEEPRIGWYNRFARHPYYGVTGINSGVMLMNMTRIRRKYFKVCMLSSLQFLFSTTFNSSPVWNPAGTVFFKTFFL